MLVEKATFLYTCSFHVNAKKDKECQVVQQLSFAIWNQNDELFTYVYTHITAICLLLFIHYLPQLFSLIYSKNPLQISTFNSLNLCNWEKTLYLKEINNASHFSNFFIPAFKDFSYSQSIWKFPHTTGLFCFVQVWIWPNTMSHSSCKLKPVIFLVTNRVSKQMNFLLPNLF